MRIWKDTAPQSPRQTHLYLFNLGKVSLGSHPKDPHGSQYLNGATSKAGLQELKKTPDHRIKRAEHVDQGAGRRDQGDEDKDQDGAGAQCAERRVAEELSATED